MSIKKIVFFTIFCITLSYAKEVSVFGAGDLSSSSPYGLTDTEKVLLNNKKKVDTLNSNYGSVQTRLNALSESIDGIQTILEGNNNQFSKIEQRLSAIESKVNLDTNSSVSIDDFNYLKKFVLDNKKAQEQNYKNIIKALKELSSIVDSINLNYVSKKGVSSKSKDTTKDFKTKKNSEIVKQADLLFKDKKFDEAKQAYAYLYDVKYRPAYCTFMLGEIDYAKKSYASAIKHYEVSVSLYKKADYMPKLLYHTAISYDKLGHKNSASKFYSALKSTYPDSQEAKAYLSKNKK